MKHHNQAHGGSKLTAVHLDEQVMCRWIAEACGAQVLEDKNFEIVYGAIEVFDDGYQHHVVCYRVSTPGWTPKVQGVPQTTTHQLFIPQNEVYQ